MNTIDLERQGALPSTLKSDDGKEYLIDPSFRVVLSCLRVLSDPDKPEIDKALYLASRFFLRHPPPDMGELFRGFVLGETQEEPDGEQCLDFVLDAGVIYASFRQQYGINLLHDELHWFEFRELLAGLNEQTPFGQRLVIRQRDVEDVAERDRAKFRTIKERLAIKPKESQREKELRAELNRRLEAGENPADILNALKEV